MQPKQFCAKLEDLHTAIASDPEACTRELDQLRRWLKPRAVEKVPLGSEGTFSRPAAPATQSLFASQGEAASSSLGLFGRPPPEGLSLPRPIFG